MILRTLGIDLGLTSANHIAFAEAATILRNRCVRSHTEALARANHDETAGEGVDLVLESTAMARFVAGVGAQHAAFKHRESCASRHKDAGLRALHRMYTDRPLQRAVARAHAARR